MHTPPTTDKTADWNNWYAGLTPAKITEIHTNIFSTDEKADYDETATIIAPPFDWNTLQDNNLWNPDSELATGVNPCPDGWRLPTEEEIKTLISNVTYSGSIFTDKITGEAVSFQLPDYAVEITQSGKITTDHTTTPCYWTSSYSTASMPIEYDPVTYKPTRYMDYYKGQAFQTPNNTKPAIVSKPRSETHYIRCVLDN